VRRKPQRPPDSARRPVEPERGTPERLVHPRSNFGQITSVNGFARSLQFQARVSF
jgi:hypothetical protein